MQHILAAAKLGVERNCGIVGVVRLNKDNPSAALSGDPFHCVDQQGSDTAPAICLCDGQIIDVELRAFLLEFRQFIGHQPANNSLVVHSDEHHDFFTRRKLLKIGRSRSGKAVSFSLFEGLSHVDLVGLSNGLKTYDCSDLEQHRGPFVQGVARPKHQPFHKLALLAHRDQSYTQAGKPRCRALVRSM